MHTGHMDDWSHDHTFNQDQKRAGELRTLFVVALTAIFMVVEISAGLIYGSMALLADGLHMASHATALGISVFAYVISRRLAGNKRFAFGVGKINSLAGFGSAVLLIGFALVMVTESVDRLMNPTVIAFNQALIVAGIGLIVNAVSAVILAKTPHHHHEHDHGDHHHHHDHNLRAAYLHVLADALTSFLAIFALLAGKFYGWFWLDPIMGVVGAVLVTRWSLGLIKDTSDVLLDKQAGESVRNEVMHAIESESHDRISDLHIWGIGDGMLAAEVAIVTHDPMPVEYYKDKIPSHLNIVHITIELNQCPNR